MSEPSARTIPGRGGDSGLWWMVLASAGLHLVAVVLLLLLPGAFGRQPPPLASYTVDLVAPDRIGGSNVVPGASGQVEAAPLTAAPAARKPDAAPATAAKVEAPEPAPQPQQPEPPQPVVKAAVRKPAPDPPPAPVQAKAEKEDVIVAAKMATIEPAPTAAKPAPPPKAAATVAPANTEPAHAPPAAAPEAPAADSQADTAARARDERIAAAIERIEQQLGSRGGGTGTGTEEQAGGPIAVGPGEGVGGAVKGVEYLLYRNQLEARIKRRWAWAGSDHSLEAAVHFSITETGEVVDVRITKASGDPGYDASVERAVRAASPLPPPPVAYRKEFSDVEYTFTPASLQM